MSKSFVAASAALIALAFVPMSLSAAEPSKAAIKTLAAANDAYKAKRCSEAISKSKEVLAIGEKNAYDTYLAYSLMAGCYQSEGNKAEMMKAFQGQLDSGYPSTAEQTQILKNMYGTAFGMKDYAQAVELGNRLIRSGAAGAEAYDQVASAMVAQGKTAEAAKFLGDFVASQVKSGQKPRESTLTLLRDLQDKSGNSNGAADTLEKLVVHYPKPDYWNLLTYKLSRDPKLNERQTMHIYRLKVATQTLKRCQDFTEMADFAINSNLAGEGEKVIQQAIAGKVCSVEADQARLQRMTAIASRAINEEKARMAKLDADARAAKTGDLDVALGSQHFGFGDYSKAVEAFSRGVGKGGLKYPADAQLTLGVAQIRAGNKAEALKTFRAIKTEDPLMQRIVRLWTLYAQ
jgi:tetratricopeptide (TPR) repeat protein